METLTMFSQNYTTHLTKPEDLQIHISHLSGLFMRDFLFFISEIKQKRDYSKDTQRTIHCMEVADDIHRFMGMKEPSWQKASLWSLQIS